MLMMKMLKLVMMIGSSYQARRGSVHVLMEMIEAVFDDGDEGLITLLTCACITKQVGNAS